MTQATAEPEIDRRKYKLEFKWWRDRDTIAFEKNQPEMADPENCFRLLSWRGPDNKSYLINNKNRRYFTSQGVLTKPYMSADLLFNARAGEDAFIFCPGPSAEKADLSLFKDRLVIAVNSAGFAFKKFAPTLWAIFESNYMLQVLQHAGGRNPDGMEVPKIIPERQFLFSSRVAIRWRGLKLEGKAPEAVYWVARFEEERLMPHRTPAVATMGAIAAAYWLGAKRAFMIGMDVSRPKGQPYMKGVPYGKDGATALISEQMPALIQVKYPGMQLFNCSPHSRDYLKPAFEPCDLADVQAAARA